MTPSEEWRRVDEVPLYEVSSLGRVRSWIAHMGRDLPHVLTGGLNTEGRRQVILVEPGTTRRKCFTIHRLVALAFLGPRPAGMHVCHNDSDYTNNALTNLRYDTVKGNVADQMARGTHLSIEMKARTHCPHGHPYSEDNTYYYTNKKGYVCRYCRECSRQHGRRRRDAYIGKINETPVNDQAA